MGISNMTWSRPAHANDSWTNGQSTGMSTSNNSNSDSAVLVALCAEYDKNTDSPPTIDCNSTDCGSMNGTTCDALYEVICAAVCGG